MVLRFTVSRKLPGDSDAMVSDHFWSNKTLEQEELFIKLFLQALAGLIQWRKHRPSALSPPPSDPEVPQV